MGNIIKCCLGEDTLANSVTIHVRNSAAVLSVSELGTSGVFFQWNKLA